MNTRTITREELLKIAPTIVSIAEVTPPGAGIGQLNEDIKREYVTFNSKLPST